MDEEQGGRGDRRLAVIALMIATLSMVATAGNFLVSLWREREAARVAADAAQMKLKVACRLIDKATVIFNAISPVRMGVEVHESGPMGPTFRLLNSTRLRGVGDPRYEYGAMFPVECLVANSGHPVVSISRFDMGVIYRNKEGEEIEFLNMLPVEAASDADGRRLTLPLSVAPGYATMVQLVIGWPLKAEAIDAFKRACPQLWKKRPVFRELHRCIAEHQFSFESSFEAGETRTLQIFAVSPGGERFESAPFALDKYAWPPSGN